MDVRKILGWVVFLGCAAIGIFVISPMIGGGVIPAAIGGAIGGGVGGALQHIIAGSKKSEEKSNENNTKEKGEDLNG